MYECLQYKSYSPRFHPVTFLPGLRGSQVFADTIFNMGYLPAGVRDFKSYEMGSVSTDPGFCPVFAYR
jgi:hypothetical protein